MTKGKHAPKLCNGHRVQLLTWLAADYDVSLIALWARQKTEDEHDPWPPITIKTIYYYQQSPKWRAQIEEARRKRYESAINTGLALKEERLARLKRHADELEAIKWVPGRNGRLWNEKAWRETLDDIAKEQGHRKPSDDMDDDKQPLVAADL